MRQDFSISRRKLVTLAAGAFAFTAQTGAAPLDALMRPSRAETEPGALLAASRRRVLAKLRDVRRANGGQRRSQAFAAFAVALQSHDLAESALGSLPEVSPVPLRSPNVTALYRQAPPDRTLATVIARELETQALDDGAWMTRFADLETVIQARLTRRVLFA